MAKQTGTVVVELKPMDIRHIEITLVGDAPLIVHRWSEKAKKEMLDKQLGVTKTKKRDPKNPEQDYLDSMYITDDGGYGFPAVGLKAAAVSAARQIDGLPMTFLRGAFHIDGELVKIDGTPSMREDMVRVGMGTADIRYRAEFKKWTTTFVIRYNTSAISAEQIVNLFDIAGFAVGIGEWRPEKDGAFGMFHVAVTGK